MSKRLRNVLFAFGLSICMWALIIQGGMAFYAILSEPLMDKAMVASIK